MKLLPDKDKFYSQLKNDNITDEYKYAQDILNKFSCRTFGDYHDLYLKTNILLLADVFESFRKVNHKNYRLDPCWYYSTPGLSWDALLKTSKIELDLLIDVDMFNFIEKGIRGRISIITKKYVVANNKYLKNYDSEFLFADTYDSLVYNIKCEDVYQDIYKHRDLFDLSEYPKSGRFHDDANKKVFGKMKDEFMFVPVREFARLRSKMYAVILDDNKLESPLA